MPSAVLLNVDDHEPGRYARTRLLVRAGYDVLEAGTGKQALDLVAEARPSLVLLDVNLPDITGVEVCRKIKSDPETASTAVLQISASAVSPPDQVRGLENGADIYLVEPVDADVLLATVRALLRMRRAEEDLQRSNLALQRSNEDLRRFAYLASHDLQEPLRTVSNFSTLLQQRYGDRLDSEGNDILGQVSAAASRMHTLIRDLLRFAQAGQDEGPVDNTVDVEAALAWAVGNLRQAQEESGASILHDPLPEVRGNYVQIAQLFQNLIGNAIKYRRPGEPTVVRVSAAKAGHGRWQFTVADNGIGIAPEYHARIFAPFTRLHGREIPGSGIGLATCQRIVERHGGRIWVESEGEGHGAAFCFTLPATHASETSA